MVTTPFGSSPSYNKQLDWKKDGPEIWLASSRRSLSTYKLRSYEPSINTKNRQTGS